MVVPKTPLVLVITRRLQSPRDLLSFLPSFYPRHPCKSVVGFCFSLITLLGDPRPILFLNRVPILHSKDEGDLSSHEPTSRHYPSLQKVLRPVWVLFALDFSTTYPPPSYYIPEKMPPKSFFCNILASKPFNYRHLPANSSYPNENKEFWGRGEGVPHPRIFAFRQSHHNGLC